MASKRVSIRFGWWGVPTVYRLEGIRNVGIVEQTYVSKGHEFKSLHIGFEYEGRDVHLRNHISAAKAQTLVEGPLANLVKASRRAE